MPRPSQRANPWPGETVEVPRRVAGHRVVCALKLATRNGERAHQWHVVCEMTGAVGLFSVWHVAWIGNGYESSDAVHGLDYGTAVHRMFTRAMRRLPAPEQPQPPPAGGREAGP